MKPASQPIKSKFYLPRLRQTLVHRPLLLSQLQVGVQRSLTLVSAPAGFGKTTLLAEWANQEARPIVWFSLDNGDNDPVQFTSNLVYAFDCLEARGITHPTPPDQSLPPQFILQTLLGELDALITDTVLMLDDYHIIQSPLVHELTVFLIEHLPAHLHLVIATRADLPIPLARLRAQAERLSAQLLPQYIVREQSNTPRSEPRFSAFKQYLSLRVQPDQSRPGKSMRPKPVQTDLLILFLNDS